MDGRVQLPVIEWVKARARVDYVDSITEPGPDEILSDGPADLVDSIRRRVGISVDAHGSRYVAVVSHGDCAGNPVPEETHLVQLRKAIEVVHSWGFAVKVVGLWVESDGWQVIEIGAIGSD